MWNECAKGNGVFNPFVSWEFLSAMEESGSASRDAGWLPCHAVLSREGEEGEVLGVAPLYIKGHSYGEYVFDHSWANAYGRLTRKNYYPKLQSCVPFSPVTGSRLLAKSAGLGDQQRNEVLGMMAGSLVAIADEMKVSSLHVTFNSKEELAHFSRERGYLTRTGIQYHWQNNGYDTFNDFLMELRQSKRKSIRQERKCAEKNGLRVYRTYGSEMLPSDWDEFYRFYINTCNKKWGEAYLNREFFHRMGEAMGDKVLVVFVEDAFGKKVAGALNLVGSDTLFGRNWGCAADLNVKNLHFEVCYYQALEAAIELGLKRVEAGAQGEHKIQRGYLPTPTYSCHWVRDSQFKQIVSNFLDEEQRQIDYTLEVLEQELSPYKQPAG